MISYISGIDTFLTEVREKIRAGDLIGDDTRTAKTTVPTA
jgi:hypothetical protein